MHARACDLAGGEQAIDRRLPVEVGLDAAHDVVRRRTDRDRVAREIEAGGAARIRNQRKAIVHERRVERRQRQVDRRAGAPGFLLDGAGDAIPRREVAGRIVARDESLAGRVDQPRAFAAQRFRQQEARLPRNPQRRRVELHELQIGDRCAGAIGHRDPVARRHRRIGRVVEDVAGAAGRKQHLPGVHEGGAAVFVQDPRPDAANLAAVVDHPELDRARVIGGAHAGERRRLRPQGPRDLAAGRIARVQHAAGAVRSLHRQRWRSIRFEVEAGAPRHQLADVGRPLANQDVDRLGIAQAVAGGECVGGVERRRIIGADCRGDAALRVGSVAVARIGLGQDQDGTGIRQLHRGPKPGDAAADDEEVRTLIHAESDPVILPSGSLLPRSGGTPCPTAVHETAATRPLPRMSGGHAPRMPRRDRWPAVQRGNSAIT